MKQYNGIANQFPILSSQQEQELLEAGGEKEREILVLSNVRLAFRIALKFTSDPFLLEDYLQEGLTGIIHAIDKYDPSYGTKFSTYCVFWIRQRIQVASRKQSIISIPSYVQDLDSKILKYEDEYTMRTGEKPSYEEIAEELSIPVHLVARTKECPEVYLEAEKCGVMEETEGETDVMRDVEESEVICKIKEELSPREYQCLRDYWVEGLTLDEVGKKQGLSKERVRQILFESVARLRESLHNVLN